MADDIERAEAAYEVILQADLTNTLHRIHEEEAQRQKTPPVCEHCEEFPAARSKLGVYSRYCTRCEEELLHNHV